MFLDMRQEEEIYLSTSHFLVFLEVAEVCGGGVCLRSGAEGRKGKQSSSPLYL